MGVVTITKENFEATPERYFLEQGKNVKEYVAQLPVSKDYKKKDLGTIIYIDAPFKTGSISSITLFTGCLLPL